MREEPNFPIDIVITWVDQNDKDWRVKYNQFKGENLDDRSETRYRDYGTLKYLFRSIETYCPWVNKVFLITDHQTPIWLDKSNSQLVLLSHDDYIEKKYLPTFNSNVIELNLGKISELSNHFILFNDDTFVNKGTKPNDFFSPEGLPLDCLALNAIMPTEIFDHIYVNNLSIINNKYSKRKNMKSNLFKYFNFQNCEWNIFTLLLTIWPKFTRFYDPHIPISFRKDILNDTLQQYPVILNQTNKEKFRSYSDFSIWVVRYIQMLEGQFKPRSVHFGKHYDLHKIKEAVKDINMSTHKLININDASEMTDEEFKEAIILLNNTFNGKFPNKSHFEV